MTPIDPLVAELADRLSADLLEDFEERAAIVQYEAATTRQLAECLALLDVLRRHPGALLRLRTFRTTSEGRSNIFLAPDRRHLAERLPVVGSRAIEEIDLALAVTVDLGGIALVTRVL